MNRYRVLLPLLVNGEHGQFDEFDYEFDVDAERTNIESGLLEIVPRRYRVLVEDAEVGGVRGDAEDPTFTAAMLIENEAALVDAGVIERVADEAPVVKKATAKKGAATPDA